MLRNQWRMIGDFVLLSTAELRVGITDAVLRGDLNLPPSTNLN
jgi:hypothetical protein